jgi:hypothetical protein
MKRQLLTKPYDVVLNSFTVKLEDENLFMSFEASSKVLDPVRTRRIGMPVSETEEGDEPASAQEYKNGSKK